MAGNYDDAPGPRMAYDRDGTIVATVVSSTINQLGSGTVAGLNDESSGGYIDTGSLSTWRVGFLFPQLRDFAGWYIARTSSSSPTYRELEWSANTTNLFDGSWTTTADSSGWGDTNAGNARDSISEIVLPAVKAVRFRITSGGNAASDSSRLYFIHLYGTIASGESVDRLRFWHPTLDEPLDDNGAADGAFLDWGDSPRSTTADKTFRIKNNSATLTANNIDVYVNVPTDTSPTVASQMSLSDGGAFAQTINIGNLAPGALSPVITFRRNLLSNADLGLWFGRILVDITSWT